MNMNENSHEHLNDKETILYIGGFELPDKNAAAHRVIGIAKGLRMLGFRVIFLNSLKGKASLTKKKKQYFGFECYEYGREKKSDYLIFAKTVIAMLSKIRPSMVIAYNYPALALQKINRVCKQYGIKCYADTTEWYEIRDGKLLYRLIKNFDSTYRMAVVQKKLDGIIAISEYLYEYYNKQIKTVRIPPTIDIEEEKWGINEKREKKHEKTFVYAGSPSSVKEELDVIVRNIINVSEKNKVRFVIVGITKDEFIQMYSWKDTLPEVICFCGRLSHIETIKLVKYADWSIIIRENDSRVVKAGFPTKLVESISCGTPVIVNTFSNIEDYINETNSIILENELDLQHTIEKACGRLLEGTYQSIFVGYKG